MFSNLVLTSSLLLSIATSAFGRDIYSTSQDGTGVSINFKADAEMSTGFDATFYSYQEAWVFPAGDTSFIESGYSANSIRTSVGGVTEPNFKITDNEHSANIYGLYNINMYNVLIELTGYFQGTY